MKKAVFLLLASALTITAAGLLAGCGDGPLSLDADSGLPPVPACLGVTQAQSCPGGPREIQTCQRMEPVTGGGWISSPVSDCLLTDLHGTSTADVYAAYCVERCP